MSTDFAASLRGGYTPSKSARFSRPRKGDRQAPQGKLTGKALDKYIAKITEDNRVRRKYENDPKPQARPTKKGPGRIMSNKYWKRQGQMAAQSRQRRLAKLMAPVEHPSSIEEVVATEKQEARRKAKGPSMGRTSRYSDRTQSTPAARKFAGSLRRYGKGSVLARKDTPPHLRPESTTEEDVSPPPSSSSPFCGRRSSSDDSFVLDLDAVVDPDILEVEKTVEHMVTTTVMRDLVTSLAGNVVDAIEMQERDFIEMMMRPASPSSEIEEVDELTEEEDIDNMQSLNQLARLVAVVRHNSLNNPMCVLAPFDLHDIGSGAPVDPLDEKLRSLSDTEHQLWREIASTEDRALARTSSDYRREVGRNTLRTIDTIRQQVLAIVGTKEKEVLRPTDAKDKSFQSARSRFLRAGRVRKPAPLAMPQLEAVPKTLVVGKEPDPLAVALLDDSPDAVRERTASAKEAVQAIQRAGREEFITAEDHEAELTQLKEVASDLERQGLLSTTGYEQQLADQQQKVDQLRATLRFMNAQVDAYAKTTGDLQELREVPQGMCVEILRLKDSLPEHMRKERAELQAIFDRHSEKPASHYTQASYDVGFGS